MSRKSEFVQKGDPSSALKNKRQEVFAREYIVDINQTQAAIRAGYPKNGAGVRGYQLLRNNKVLARIEYLLEERTKTLGIDAFWVVQNIIDIYKRCMEGERVMVFDQIEKCMVQKTKGVIDHDGAEKEIGIWQFDSREANKSMELIGKHLGMFKEKPQQNMKQVINWAIGASPFMQATESADASSEVIKLNIGKKKIKAKIAKQKNGNKVKK